MFMKFNLQGREKLPLCEVVQEISCWELSVTALLKQCL